MSPGQESPPALVVLLSHCLRTRTASHRAAVALSQDKKASHRAAAFQGSVFRTRKPLLSSWCCGCLPNGPGSPRRTPRGRRRCPPPAPPGARVGSAGCYWNRYGRQCHHPAQRAHDLRDVAERAGGGGLGTVGEADPGRLLDVQHRRLGVPCGAKEMMQPCLVHLHLISLVARRTQTWRSLRRQRDDAARSNPPASHLFGCAEDTNSVDTLAFPAVPKR